MASVKKMSGYKLKKRRISKKKWLVLPAIVLIAAAFVGYLNAISPFLVNYCEAKVSSLTSTLINRAICDTIDTHLTYDDFVKIERNSSNEIVSIETNAASINKLASEATRIAEKYLSEMSEQKVKVPLGTMLGTPVFAGLGPNISFEVLPVGVVDCVFLSDFESAGINQTCHKIYLDMSATVNVILPMSESKVKASMKILVGENIIVGKIPDTFLQLGSLNGKGLDLIP